MTKEEKNGLMIAGLLLIGLLVAMFLLAGMSSSTGSSVEYSGAVFAEVLPEGKEWIRSLYI